MEKAEKTVGAPGEEEKQAITEENLDEMIEKSFWRDVLYEIINTMDPWDIDISELATRYSTKIDRMKEMNFRIPANVVIVSAVLLRMKSQFMKFSDQGFDIGADEFMDEGDLDMEGMGLSIDQGLLSALGGMRGGELADSLLVRPKRVPKRRITALELIAAIQQVLEDKALRNRIKDSYVEKGLVITLNQDIKHLIEETYRRVMEILSRKEEVMFSELAHERDEMVSTFISLLHLSNKQKLKLRQEKMFEELYIRL